MTRKTRYTLIAIQVLLLYIVLMFFAKHIDDTDFKVFYLSLTNAPKTTSFFLLGTAITIINTHVFLRKK